MPYVADVYQLPPGTAGTPNTTIESAKYNTFINDIATAQNTPRPVLGGGTGGVTAVAGNDGLNTQSANIASGATTNLATATGVYVNITGTTTITSFGTVQAGAERVLTFAGVLTLTHNAASLILPGGVSITTAAGDTATMRSLGGGNWKCIDYVRASGQPIATTLADSLMPARLGAAQASFMADANTAQSDGWYVGNPATANQPTATYYLYEVVSHIAGVFLTQTAHDFTTAAAANTQAYRRHMQSGVWGAWYKLQLSQTEQDARYVQASALGPQIKANLVFTMAGAAITIVKNYNIASVVRNSAGLYTITFTNAMADANYAVFGTSRLQGGGSESWSFQAASRTTGSCQIFNKQVGGIGPGDVDYLSFTVVD